MPQIFSNYQLLDKVLCSQHLIGLLQSSLIVAPPLHTKFDALPLINANPAAIAVA